METILIRNVFVDQRVTAAIASGGYAAVDLLSKKEVEQLRDAYAAFASPRAAGFHATMYNLDAGYREAVFHAIRSIVARPVARVMRGYSMKVANWVVKEAGMADSTVGFHQDWSFVDENRTRSFNVWLPLIDVDTVNGCLEMVGGSHRMSSDHRCHVDRCRFAEVSALLIGDYTQSVPVRAGQAVIYDGALLHRSSHNRSGDRRVAIGTVWVADDAQIIHADRISATTAEVFAVDESFFWRHQPGIRPQGTITLGMTASATAQHSSQILPLLSRAQVATHLWPEQPKLL